MKKRIALKFLSRTFKPDPAPAKMSRLRNTAHLFGNLLLASDMKAPYLLTRSFFPSSSYPSTRAQYRIPAPLPSTLILLPLTFPTFWCWCYWSQTWTRWAGAWAAVVSGPRRFAATGSCCFYREKEKQGLIASKRMTFCMTKLHSSVRYWKQFFYFVTYRYGIKQCCGSGYTPVKKIRIN